MIRAVLDEIRHLDTGTRTLRSFGRTVGVVVLGLGLIVAWFRLPGDAPVVERIGRVVESLGSWSIPTVLAAIGLALVLSSLARPSLLRGPYLVWMGLALVMGYVMTRVLLTIVFLVVLTPIALAVRLAGRDAMQRRPDRSMKTYWIEKTRPEDFRASLERYW